jgi:hypothetical protein
MQVGLVRRRDEHVLILVDAREHAPQEVYYDHGQGSVKSLAALTFGPSA